MDDKYLKVLKDSVLNPEIMKEEGKKLKVVYTPLHGTGNTIAEKLLRSLGIENLYVVPEQKDPDGNFPTVDYPNPEDPKAFKMALELAKKVDADVVLATDPDADRLGIYAKDEKTGNYMNYTGNMSALLIAEYRISQMKEKGILPKNGMLIKTIVSSNLADAIAKEYNLELIEVLTGFKNIGAVMKKAEENKDKTSLTDEELEFITRVVSSHMGEWNTNPYSDIVLPLPNDKYQRFVHMCDFLSSRKFLDIKFENNDIED